MPTNKKRYNKTFGTRVINSQLNDPPPTLGCNYLNYKNEMAEGPLMVFTVKDLKCR